MNDLDFKMAKEIKKNYPPGTRIELDFMDDPQAPSIGTKGTVRYVDAIGTIHTNWDNGSTLGLIPDKDKFHIIEN